MNDDHTEEEGASERKRGRERSEKGRKIAKGRGIHEGIVTTARRNV